MKSYNVEWRDLVYNKGNNLHSWSNTYFGQELEYMLRTIVPHYYDEDKPWGDEYADLTEIEINKVVNALRNHLS